MCVCVCPVTVSTGPLPCPNAFLFVSLSSDVLALPIFKQEDSSLPSDRERSGLNPPFQYVLCAATSPAVKLHDETLTYLNQGDLVLSWNTVVTMCYIYTHTHTYCNA